MLPTLTLIAPPTAHPHALASDTGRSLFSRRACQVSAIPAHRQNTADADRRQYHARHGNGISRLAPP